MVPILADTGRPTISDTGRSAKCTSRLVGAVSGQIGQGGYDSLAPGVPGDRSLSSWGWVPASARNAWGKHGHRLADVPVDRELDVDHLPDANISGAYPDRALVLAVWPNVKPGEDFTSEDASALHLVSGPWSVIPDNARRITFVVAIRHSVVVGVWAVHATCLRLRRLPTGSLDLGCSFSLSADRRGSHLKGQSFPASIRTDVIMLAPAELLESVSPIARD